MDRYGRLISRVAEGDREALSVIYDELKNEIFRFSFSLLRSKEEAEDNLHDTVVRIYEKSSTYSGGSGKSWIFTVAHRIALNRIRSRGRELADDELLKGISCDEPRIHSFEELVAFVDDELDRKILVLRIDCGFKLNEIAKMLDITPNAASKRYRKALQKLKSRV